MTKVLIITRNFPPTICGIGDHSKELMENLQAWGTKAYVLTCENTGAESLLRTQVWEERVFLTKGRFQTRLLHDIKLICRKYSIRTILWQYSPNSFSRLGLPFFLLPLMTIFRVKGFNQIVYFHEASLRSRGYGTKQFLQALLQQFISRSIAFIAHRNVTSIPFYQQYLWPSTATVIPVGANIKQVYRNTSFITQTLDTNPTLFCFANRVNAILIEAIANIDRPIKIIFAGKTSKVHNQCIKNWLEAFGISDNASVYGILSPEKIADLMQTADIYMQPEPLYKKTQGGVSAKNGTIIAAMSMAKPIISTCGDMTDLRIFKNGENILFVNYNSVEEYSYIIKELIFDSEKKREIGLAAKATYEKYFAWPVIAENINNIINE